MLVRESEPQEAIAIAALLNRAYTVEREIVEDSPDTAETVADDQRDGAYLVAIDSVRGLVSCVLVRPSGFIMRLAVEPELQNQGIGKALMNEAEARLQRIGQPEAYVSILSARPTLRQYYERLGYVATGETRPLAISSRTLVPCHLVKMAKRLTHPQRGSG